MSNSIKFKCTKCGDCCFSMGPVPLVLEDIDNWVKNKTIANMMPYIRLLQMDKNVPNLYLTNAAQPDPKEIFKEEKVDPQAKCPFFNSAHGGCQLFLKEDYRPLYCKSYPMEYDGKNFNVIDSDCPGLSAEDATEENAKEMLKGAKRFFTGREQLNHSMPALLNVFQPFIIKQMLKMQEEMMKNMSPEELEKLKKEQQ